MSDRPGAAQAKHQDPVAWAHILKMKRADDTHQQAPHDAGPKEAGCGAVEAGDISREQAVKCEHESGENGDDRIGGEHSESWL